MDHTAEIDTFCLITGAPPHVATNYLSAHDWDLHRSVEFYLDHPAEDVEDLDADLPPPRAPLTQLQAEHQHAAEPLDERESELQQALEDSLRAGGSIDLTEEPDAPFDENMAFLAQQRQSALAAQRQAQADLEGYTNLTRSNEDWARSPIAPTAAGPSTVHPWVIDDIPALPDGINVEEAKMLEAAFLGIPYEGPVQHSNPQPVSPTSIALQNLRQEQDEAYEESLRADRAKAEAVRAAQELERVHRESREAAEQAEALRSEQEHQIFQELLQAKNAALPPQPQAGDPESISIIIRMPDGSRYNRRFRKGDQLKVLFDFVDVESNGQIVKPASYQLVVPYPRKVLDASLHGSLAEMGLVDNQVLNVQVKAS